MKKIKSFTAISIILMFSALGILIFACSGKTKSREEQTHKEETKKEEGIAIVQISEAQYNQLKIQLGSIEQKNLSSTLRATGVLKVPPQNKANITSPIGGTVQNILVMEGDHVQKGQTVASLTNPEFIKMQEEFLETVSQFEFAKAEYERQKTLSEKDVTAQKTFQQTKSNYETLNAKQTSLNLQFQQLNIDASQISNSHFQNAIPVKSPISGNISHIEINIGSTVEPSKDLMNVVDNSQLHLDAFIFEQDLGKIIIGQTINVSLTNLAGKNYTAKIFAIGSAFEGESKTIPVHATITGDKKGLIEGMNIIAYINIGDNLTTAVLNNAITSNAGNDFIFIQSIVDEKEKSESEPKEIKEEDKEAGNKFFFQRIPVMKGVTQGAYTSITLLKEIPDDAKVVTNGSFYLMSIITNAGEEGE